MRHDVVLSPRLQMLWPDELWAVVSGPLNAPLGIFLSRQAAQMFADRGSSSLVSHRVVRILVRRSLPGPAAGEGAQGLDSDDACPGD